MIYVKHHLKCIGNCGFCKQLKESGEEDPFKPKNEPEVVFAWDESSVYI